VAVEAGYWGLFGFRNKINFVASRTRIGERLLGNRGGGVDPNNCPRCGGTGYIAQSVDVSGKSEGIAFIRVKCPACAGSGRNDSIPPSTAG